jgi:hypothetical protein
MPLLLSFTRGLVWTLELVWRVGLAVQVVVRSGTLAPLSFS